jgi:SOS-response transcriptional repressor LexA
MDMKTLVQRIDQRLEALGLTATEVSKRATGSADTIRNWKRAAAKGSKTGASVRTLEPVARVLGTKVEWLMASESTGAVDGVSGPVPVSTFSVPFGGRVGAGGFLPVHEYFDQDDDNQIIPQTVVKHPGFPGIPQHAWLVEGTSMDQAGIYNGMWVVAASYLDYIDKVGELTNGQYVIAERTRFGGSERELTIKEVQFARAGIRLVPRSSDPRHKELFIPLDAEADNDAETVAIIAVVLAATVDFTNRR